MGFNNLFGWTTSCCDDCWYEHPRLNELQTCDNIVFFPVLMDWLVFNAEYVLPSLAVWTRLLKPKTFCISIIILHCSTERNLSQYIIHKAKTRGKNKAVHFFQRLRMTKPYRIYACDIWLWGSLSVSQVCCFQITLCQKSNTKQFLFIIKAIIKPGIVVRFISSLHQKK